eukprot:2303379-Amphidinium_carterae.2
MRHCTIVIFTDSASLISQLTSLPGKAPAEIHAIVRVLQAFSPTRVKLQHVPAHCGLAVHDAVDQLVVLGLEDRLHVSGTIPVHAEDTSCPIGSPQKRR